MPVRHFTLFYKKPLPSLVFTLVFFTLILSAISTAASLSRDMPSRVDPGSSFSVKLFIPDTKAGESLTVEETLPSGVVLTSWDVSGVKESKADLQKDPKMYRVKGLAYGWSMTPTGPVTLSYTATAPSSQGNLNFEAVWFDPSGFNRNQATLLVGAASADTAIPAPVAAPSPVPATSPTSPQSPAARSAPITAKTPSSGTTWVWTILAIIVLGGIAWWYFKK